MAFSPVKTLLKRPFESAADEALAALRETIEMPLKEILDTFTRLRAIEFKSPEIEKYFVGGLHAVAREVRARRELASVSKTLREFEKNMREAAQRTEL